MNWAETIRTGLDAVRAHRMRSALTMLGILIGVAAVMLTVGLGQGAQASVNQRINALGSNLLVVTPGSSTSTGGVRGGAGTASTLTEADAVALRDRTAAPDIAGVAPTVQKSESLTAEGTNWTTTVVGTTEDWAAVRSRTIGDGRFLSADDVTGHGAVVVLGATTAQQLFGTREPVGRTVAAGGVPLTVIGVLDPAGSSAGANQDDQAVLPLSTAADRVIGGTAATSVQNIYLQAASQDVVSAAYQEAEGELLALHHDVTPDSADFTITSQQSILDTANQITDILTVVLSGIAGISLLVGGIGVMNIMLVSVTERIREIGLRKALGATPKVIRRQFLVEAAVLGLAGGVCGTILGIVGSVLLATAIGQPVVVSVPATLLALAVSIGIGLAFGVYPASRAARLAPIDALRSE
ncbi:ABC transporter permease [Pseudonocardia endophytica]|uniref:Putative ABC transport system permease protein n=1 Tax=Pseudonocardia endophytica TaxID=401976 RepID=A0A4R1I9D4_PSEEN|nr:ABC transporter permease [Pseudonocardia endophytica]TCK26842.1 putative ABC transport system permease protein [Pseudonocardia endophytica]